LGFDGRVGAQRIEAWHDFIYLVEGEM
jgi:hypothetical protein